MDPKLKKDSSVVLVDLKKEGSVSQDDSMDLDAGEPESSTDRNDDEMQDDENYTPRSSRKQRSGLVLHCAHCNYTCNTKRKMVSHQIVHSSCRPYVCTLCNYSSKRKRDLNIHINVVHNNVYQYVCNRCEFKSKYHKSFKNHMESHEREVVLKCPDCEYNTPRKTWLKNHMKTVGHGLVACERCDYKAPSMKQMNYHMKTHPTTVTFDELKANMTLFPCDKCKYIGTSQEVWQNHMNTHEKEAAELSCKFCDYLTSDMSVFVDHVRRFHLDEIESQRDIGTQEESSNNDVEYENYHVDDQYNQFHNGTEEKLNAYNTDGDIKLTIEESRLNDWKEVVFRWTWA